MIKKVCMQSNELIFISFPPNLLHFLVVLEKIRVPVVVSHISVRFRVLPEPENRDRVDSGNRIFGSGFGYPITRAASNKNLKRKIDSM